MSAEVTIGTEVQELADDPFAGLADALGAFLDPRIAGLVDADAVTADPPITDPVGSAGNPSLWELDEEDERERAPRTSGEEVR